MTFDLEAVWEPMPVLAHWRLIPTDSAVVEHPNPSALHAAVRKAALEWHTAIARSQTTSKELVPGHLRLALALANTCPHCIIGGNIDHMKYLVWIECPAGPLDQLITTFIDRELHDQHPLAAHLLATRAQMCLQDDRADMALQSIEAAREIQAARLPDSAVSYACLSFDLAQLATDSDVGALCLMEGKESAPSHELLVDHELQTEAVIALRSGEPAAFREQASSLLERRRSIGRDKNVETIALLVNLAITAYLEHDYAEAQQHLAAADKRCERTVYDPSFLRARILAMTAETFRARGKSGTAARLRKEAEEIHRRAVEERADDDA